MDHIAVHDYLVQPGGRVGVGTRPLRVPEARLRHECGEKSKGKFDFVVVCMVQVQITFFVITAAVITLPSIPFSIQSELVLLSDP